MFFKKFLFLGITTAVFASLGAVLYAKFYNDTINDYSPILSYLSIAAACTFVAIFACIAFWASTIVLKAWGEFVFNFLFAAGSMISILHPLTAQVEGDDFDYFMVYAIPLHFFPVLTWFAFKPLFFREKVGLHKATDTYGKGNAFR